MYRNRLLFIASIIFFSGYLSIYAETIKPILKENYVELPAEDSVKIPLQRAGSFLFTDLVINGEHIGPFLVDTGATHINLTQKYIDQLHLPKAGRAVGQTATGPVEVDVCAVDTIMLGGISLNKTFVYALGNEKEFVEKLGMRQDIAGVLGMEFLRRVPFSLDTGAGVLTLYRPDRFTPLSDPPTRLKPDTRSPVIQGELGKDEFGWILIDSGAKISMMTLEYAKQRRSLMQPTWSKLVLIFGVSGSGKKAQLVRVPHVQLFQQPPADVDFVISPDLNPEYAVKFSAVAGMNLLSNTKLTFDYDKKLAWSAPSEQPDTATWIQSFPARDLANLTPLMHACLQQRIDCLQRLLQQGADVHAQDASKKTALFYAVMLPQTQAAALLLQAGADVNAKAVGDQTPLLAVTDETINPKMVALLIHSKADVNAEDVAGRTALMHACRLGDLESVELLLEAGAKITAESPSFGNPLYAAAESGNAQIVRLLLEQKDIDIQAKVPNDGWTPLMAAAYAGHTEVVQLLLEQGARVDDVTDAKMPALTLAAGNNHIEIVKLLLEANAATDIRDQDRLTPLDYATAGGHVECMRLLYEWKN